MIGLRERPLLGDLLSTKELARGSPKKSDLGHIFLKLIRDLPMKAPFLEIGEVSWRNIGNYFVIVSQLRRLPITSRISAVIITSPRRSGVT